jgi:2-keto-4-pentenoate hydratase
MAEARRIAEAFVSARKAGTALPDYPGDLPATLAEAYAIQDAAIAFDGRPVVGWKVGRIARPLDGADRLAGPIFAGTVADAAIDPVPMPIFADGFGAAEAEFLLRVGTAPDLARQDYTNDEAAALIDRVCVGIEIASSPFPGIHAGGPAVTVSDFGNNNGLVVGEAIPDWRDLDLNAWPVELRINGDVAGRATAATMLDGPFGAARFLFGHLARRGIAVAPGTWISSGAVTGVHQVVPGDRVEARFDERLSLECVIRAR